MKKIVWNLTAYWTFLLAILVLCAAEVYGSLGIADAIYNMKHTGNETKGYTYLVAGSLDPSMYRLVEEYMSDREKMAWQESYNQDESGNYVLKSDVKFASTLAELEEEFLVPQAVANQVLTMSSDEWNELLEENELLETDHLEIRDLIEENLESQGNNAIRQNAWQFISSRLEESGVNLQTSSNSYMFRCLFRIVICLLITCLAAWGNYAVYERVRQTIYRRMEDREMRSAQLCLVLIVCACGYALMLAAITLMDTGKGYRMADCIWFLIIAVSGTVIDWLLLKLPALERVTGFLHGFADMNRYRKAASVSIMLVLPAVPVVFGIIGIISIQAVYRFYMVLSAAIFIKAAFFLPAVFAQADIMDSETSQPQDQEEQF